MAEAKGPSQSPHLKVKKLPLVSEETNGLCSHPPERVKVARPDVGDEGGDIDHPSHQRDIQDRPVEVASKNVPDSQHTHGDPDTVVRQVDKAYPTHLSNFRETHVGLVIWPNTHLPETPSVHNGYGKKHQPLPRAY